MTQISKCYDNIIGLRNSCDFISSASGIYINDIGISLNELNDFVSSDFQNGEELFQSQKNLAIQIVSQQIHSYFNSRYKPFTLIENRRVGYFQDNVQMIIGNSEYKGMLIELDAKGSYVSFFLNEFSLQTNYTGVIPIQVFDLLQNKLIDSFNVQSVANELVTTYPNRTYNSDKNRLQLFIGYDTTGKQYITSSPTQSAGCASCNTKPNYANEFVTISCGKTSLVGNKTKQNINPANDCGGTSIIYSLNCNHENWLCSFSNLIALPIAFKTASLLMEYGMLITPNEMLTNRSTLNRDLLKERLQLYEAKFNDSMNGVLNNIDLPHDERCFVCRQQSRTTIMLP